jgi:hypothetical protein
MNEPLESLPGPGTSETDSGIKWLPEVQWDKKQQKLGQLRIGETVPEQLEILRLEQ